MARNIKAREKGLEDVPLMGGIDPHPRIAHRDFYTPLRSSSRGHLDLSAIRRELDGVQQEVIQAIPNLVSLNVDGTQVRRQVERQFLPPQVNERQDILRRLMDDRRQIGG